MKINPLSLIWFVAVSLLASIGVSTSVKAEAWGISTTSKYIGDGETVRLLIKEGANDFYWSVNVPLSTTNNNLRIDGFPKATLFQRVIGDPEQQFIVTASNFGPKWKLLKLNKRDSFNRELCLNAHYFYNLAPVNVYPCNPSDSDQAWSNWAGAGVINYPAKFISITNKTTYDGQVPGYCLNVQYRQNLQPLSMYNGVACSSSDQNSSFWVVPSQAPPNKF